MQSVADTIIKAANPVLLKRHGGEGEPSHAALSPHVVPLEPDEWGQVEAA
jgi:hypothetical protein